MWVHPDIVKDEQWETNKPKGRSCNVVSLAVDDDFVIAASLSDSEGEEPALAAQPFTSQSVGTRSGKQYLQQYNRHQMEHPNQQCQESLHLSSPQCQRTKKRRKRLTLMNLWRRILPKDSILPSALTYWHNWPISQLVLLCMSYSASPRRWERNSGMLLLIRNHFSCKYLSLQKKMELHVPDVIWYIHLHPWRYAPQRQPT